MKVLRKIIEINEDLCNGCGQCVTGCAEAALEIIDGKAKLIAEKYCDGLGACLGECPTGALKIVEREVEDFDEAAVEELIAAKKRGEAQQPAAMACGCASSHIQSFGIQNSGPTATPCQSANQPRGFAAAPPPPRAPMGASMGALGGEGQPSALTHWPIQIRLVPPVAPFLNGADLLIAADCAPVAHPNFNRELLPGKTVLLGCPKFDDAESYVAKFSEIFQVAAIKSITIAIMEVPCCGSMRGIVKAAQQRAGTSIPVKEVVIGVRGNIL